MVTCFSDAAMNNEKIWEKILHADRAKLDFLLHLGDEELRTQTDARFSIRNRCQTLLILLITGISASGLTFLMSDNMCQSAFLLIATAFWSWQAWHLFDVVKSAPRMTAHGKPTDNIFYDAEGETSLETTKLHKLYAIELTINEVMSANSCMAKSFNRGIRLASVGLVCCAIGGILTRLWFC